MTAPCLSSAPRLLASGLVALDVLRRDGSERAVAFRAGGTAGNVASILGALGWSSMAAGPADSSLAFRLLLDDLRECGVEYYVTTRAAVPVIVQELCDQAHHFSFDCTICGRPLPRFKRPVLEADARLRAWSRHADVFFADRLSDDVIELARNAHASGTFVVYEPSDANDAPWAKEMLAIAGMVKCSSERAPKLGWLQDEGEYLDVHTMGSEGLRWRWSAIGVGEWQVLPAVPAERVVDTCGAGDWLTSGILFGLREYSTGLERGARRCVEQVMRSAQTLAAWSVGFAGARGALYEQGPAVARQVLGACPVDVVRDAPLAEPAMATACVSCPV